MGDHTEPEWLQITRRHESAETAATALGISRNALHLRLQRRGLRSPGVVGTAARESQEDPPTLPHSEPPREWPHAPPPVIEGGELQRVLIIPDVHVPYHDELAWRCCLATARAWQPHTAIILGDFGDFYMVSQYAKDPSRKMRFADEITHVRHELDCLASLRIPDVRYCEGNHETRLKRLINSQAAAIAGAVTSDAAQLLDVSRHGWQWIPYGHHTRVGKLAFTHDCGKAGVYAARQSLMAFGSSVVIGHTHRAMCHYESTLNDERHVGWSMGWLGDYRLIDYRHHDGAKRDNQLGFGVAHVEPSTGLFWVTFVPVIEGRCVVDGVMYDGRSER